jgi:DNA-binding protein HU-beta
MSVITKAELIEAAAKAGGISKSAASVAVNAVFDTIVTSVARGNRVALVGFGAFVPRKRNGRSGRNPGNGSEIRIPAKTVPAFTPGQAFREAVDRRR